MSIHQSLKLKNKLVGRRNVLTRVERLMHLQKAGEWKEGEEVFGLPKLFIKPSGIVQVKTMEEKNAPPTYLEGEAPVVVVKEEAPVEGAPEGEAPTEEGA